MWKSRPTSCPTWLSFNCWSALYWSSQKQRNSQSQINENWCVVLMKVFTCQEVVSSLDTFNLRMRSHFHAFKYLILLLNKKTVFNFQKEYWICGSALYRWISCNGKYNSLFLEQTWSCTKLFIAYKQKTQVLQGIFSLASFTLHSIARSST